MGKIFPLHILLAEDNRTNQIVAAGLLGKLGYPVEVVENGRLVIQRLEQQFYDLILMDCHMPEMDGFQTTQAVLNKYRIGPRPRIVALTASTMKEDIDRCISSGMDAFLSKPITMHTLIQTLRESFKIKNQS